jgi:hypothetical protein
VPLRAILMLSQGRVQEAYQTVGAGVKAGGMFVVGMLVKARVEMVHHKVRIAQRAE